MSPKWKTFGDFPALWVKHEKLYYSIFKKALQRLETKADKDENEISESLCLILLHVCLEIEGEVSPPDWEKPIPPVTENDLTGGKKRKRPDFTCNIINSNTTEASSYCIPFHVECKRLGKQKGSWNFNKNYVIQGINRFDSVEHGYSKRAPSGMMIGYIINMEPFDILESVNNYMPDQLPKLNFDFSEKVVTCEQDFTRKYIEPEQFNLIHLWSDLRS